MELPGLTVGDGTNYGVAFRVLADTIEADLAALRREGCKAYPALRVLPQRRRTSGLRLAPDVHDNAHL
jgi:hypothetical protein